MRWVTFANRKRPQESRLGFIFKDLVIELDALQDWAFLERRVQGEALPGTMFELIQAGPEAWKMARELVNTLQGVDPLRQTGPGERKVGRRLEDVFLLPPLPRPMSLRDFYAFEQHVKTAYANRQREVPPEWYQVPVFYFSNPNAIFGPGEVIPYPSSTQALDFELEVACVIGQSGINLTEAEAESYIFGYTIFNDWSARDVQKLEMQVGLGPAKGKDFASSLGPWIITPDELQDCATDRVGVYDLEMVARVNGEQRSLGNWKDLYYSFGEMIARASQDTYILPGDVIGSGTVGSGCLLELTGGQGPWLQSGDRVELEVERLGVLSNRVSAPAKTKAGDR